MVDHVDILPGSATDWERLFGEVNDPLALLGENFDGIRAADQNPPPSFMPWLVWQYGLGELTPFLPNLYDLVRDGILWQRERGTPASIRRGLDWIGYDAEIEEEPSRRLRWNRFQLLLDRVRDADVPDLSRIAGITQLSVPARSKFARGFRGYDIRAGETSFGKTSGCLTSDHSGVYLPGIAPKWSFGRSYSADVTLGETALTDLGVWIEPVGTSDVWADADYLWDGATFPWSVPGEQSRRATMAEGVVEQSAWVRFRRAGGAIVGHARAIARPVKQVSSGGAYTIAATQWSPDPADPFAVHVLATSGFGDGAGETATTMSVVFGATLATGIPPGRLWIGPGHLVGGVEIAQTPVSIPFGLSVRERTQFILRL